MRVRYNTIIALYTSCTRDEPNRTKLCHSSLISLPRRRLIIIRYYYCCRYCRRDMLVCPRLTSNCFASEKNMTRVRLPPLCYGVDTRSRAPAEARACNRKSELRTSGARLEQWGYTRVRGRCAYEEVPIRLHRYW